jgi:hypothetical protein
LKQFARHVLEATDDLASQIQATRNQGNFGQSGPPAAPHPVTAIAVTKANGFGTVTLTHNSAPAGTNYVIEYSATPNFQSSVQVDNGISLTMQQYLKGQTLYFRAAPKFPTSALAPWTYLGGAAKPTAVTF